MKGKKYEGSPKKVMKEESDKENTLGVNKSLNCEVSQNPGFLNNPASFGFPFPVAGSMMLPPYYVP
jgi:hypothetical protein